MTTTLSLTDYLAISPLLILLITTLALLVVECFFARIKKLTTFITLTGLFSAILACYQAPISTNPLLTNWLTFDTLQRSFAILFLSVGIATTLISSPFFKRFQANKSEYYFFLLASLFGLLLLASANDFLTLFLGLETLSIALYVLCGYMKEWLISHEAAFKYFLLGSVSTAFLLFGIALVYGATGTTRFDLLPQALVNFNAQTKLLFMGGTLLITVGLLFKAAVVPFHIWAPDVYAGAPSPVTAFMAVATKAGAFAAFMRLFLVVFPDFDPLWHQIIAFLVYPTLIYANFVAIKQVQLRRFFAYSGISHAGFLLIPLAAGTQDASSAMFFYLVVYALATIGSFAVLSFIDTKNEGVMLTDVKGLFYTSPLLATIFAISLLTLAGIPPTVGFFAKFYLLKVAFAAGYYGLVIVGLLTTILAAYYYLRIVALLLTQKQELPVQPLRSKSATCTALFSMVAIICVSFFPEPLLQLFSTISHP